MGTSNYEADLQDIHFVLFDQLKVHEHLEGVEGMEDFDRDMLESVLSEAARLSEEVLGPIDPIGDREGVKLDADGNVTTPDCFNAAWDAMAEGGWLALDLPQEVGGTGAPHSIGAACTEMFGASAMAFAMYTGLTVAANRTLIEFAPDSLRDLVVGKLAEGVWAGTMCLTEAGAGSDVGSNRAKAVPTDEEGVFLLEGEKIFISGGDQDLTENIVHLVLARTPGAPDGTKGLSIFLVPKFEFDADGTLGRRNDAYVRGIEEKMGLHGSATCTLVLGATGDCKGYLLGQEGQGMPIMFTMMNEARLGVGIQGLAAAANAYQNALAYARDRKQGASIQSFRDASAPRVSILAHPDVRRMMMWQKCQVEAMRSLALRVAHLSDLALHGPEEEREAHRRRIDLLTPVVKGHLSDVGFECTVQAIQVLGGYGYIGEYPVEQHMRDVKISSIYEGTNGIQAMDLLGRKMRMGGGQVFIQWMTDAQALCQRAEGTAFGAHAKAVYKSLQQLGATAMFLGGLAGQGNLPAAMLQATPFLRMFGVVALAVELVDQALVAQAMMDEGSDSAHVASKALNLRFYVAQILPSAIAIGKGIQSDDGAALDEVLFA